MSSIIRQMKESDFDSILLLIKELAEYEKELDQVVITKDVLINDFKTNCFDGFVAEIDNKIVGMALFYNRYSTWKGLTLHLEDLIVTQKYRHKGIGKELLNSVINFAKEKQINRLEWSVLDWNKNAIDFYKKTGADILEDWYLVQMSRKQIENYENL